MGLEDNKSPWASLKTIEGPLEIPDLHTPVDREFCTKFVAERLQNKHEDIRALRDKIGKQIDTALKNGDLIRTDGKILFGDFVGWVKTKQRLAKSVDGLASLGHATVNVTLPAFTASGLGFRVPSSLPECQAALADAYRELNAMRHENSAQSTTIEALAPFKAKAEARSLAAKAAGKQGGRGNTK